ncbi:MAG: hypothetical protein NTX05_07165 [Fusobacteria bacterium]|nr:hypothetical protein [Fusobacteriota bacterium]
MEILERILSVTLTEKKYLFKISFKKSILKYIISLCLIVVATGVLISSIHTSFFFVFYAIIMYGLAFYGIFPILKFSIKIDLENEILNFNGTKRDISQIKVLAVGRRALLKQKKIIRCVQVITHNGEEIIIPLSLVSKPIILLAILTKLNHGKIDIKE